MNSERVTDYFIVAGLPPQPVLLEDSTTDLKPTSKNEPITDICVIVPLHGEECPPGYKPLLQTPRGEIADLNHGSIRSPEVFICFRRGRDKSPLTDIGVLYEGSERVLDGCEVVYTTPYGRPANINNTANRIYLTYRRAQETASSDTLAVTDICVINASKGEKAPHSFCKIDKNLNQAMMSSSIYLCYKKSMCKDYSIAYKPGVLSRYPAWDWPDFPLSESSVAMFGLPMGAVLESWPEKAAQAKSVFATFVLTGLNGKKVYGAAVTFYELYQDSENLTPAQSKTLGLHLKKKRLVYVNKAICVLAKRPFFSAFKNFLLFIYKETLSKKPRDLPIERLISHFMWDVPFPSPERPRVLAQLSDNCTVAINLPDESPIPLSGSSFSTMLRNLGVENTVSLLIMTLLESKILIHSLRPAVLTGVIEAVGSMIFPFSWQCPYIPLCPLGIAEVLFAPLPYIVGVDSRYFDLYDPPIDVTCVDLDTNTISKPSGDKLLPKRPTKVLRATLEKLYYQSEQRGHSSAHDEKALAAEKALDILIQEAFLRFMAAILKGYKNFLLPITSAPSDSSTSVKQLFDVKGFVKSRDKAYHKLFEQIVRTQAFTRFIEERSFNIRDDTSFLFFDECTECVDENYDTPKLLEIDPYKSDRTAYISAPQPDDTLSPPYTYDFFPNKLNHDLFCYKEKPPYEPGVDTTLLADKKTFIARRSKAEIKAALRFASMSKKGIAASTLWSKCLVSNTFSMWFVHLPSFILASQTPHPAMSAACAILKKMQEYRLHTPDEMCYCTMMQLCGIYKLPVLAVKVLCEMRSINLNANAVTYGYYNKAVLENKWPSESSNAQVKWRRIRHLILGVSQFKVALRSKRRSDDVDSLSRGSGDSGEVTLDNTEYAAAAAAVSRKEDVVSTASDVGYSSMSQEDILKYTPRVDNSAKAIAAGRENDAFRAKVGSIIRRSMSREIGIGHNFTESHLESSAGLLITAKREMLQVPLGCSLNEGDRAAFAEAKRKRHKSAGDHLKHSVRQDSEELGCSPLDNVNAASVPDSAISLPQTAEENIVDIPSSQPLDTSNAMLHNEQNGISHLIDLAITPTASNKSSVINYDVFDPLSGANFNSNNEILSSQLLDPMKTSIDSQKKQTVVSDDPLGLFSAQSPGVERSTPKCDDANENANLMSTSATSATSMDIGNLFGRDSSPKKTVNSTKENSAANGGVKKYNLLQFTPEKEALPELDAPSLRKSVSLDSRNSYKAALRDEDTKSADAVLNESQFDNPFNTPSQAVAGSKESLNSVGGGSTTALVPEGGKTPTSYKDWMTTSIKKGATLAITKNLSSKVKSMVYGEKGKPKPELVGTMSSHESLDSIGSTPKAVKRRDDMRSSLKKIKSVSSSMASKLYSNYNKLKHTVKEYQAPSTVTTPYKEDRTSDARNNDDNVSLLSSHSGLGMASSTDDAVSTQEEGNKPFNTAISYAGVSPAFITKYTTSTGNLRSPDTIDSVFNFPTAAATTAELVLEVVMCSATICENCSSILYDEDIMAGWSAQDSDLSTTCRFCDKKQVPFMNIDMKDLRPKGDRKSVSIDEGFLSSPPLTPRSNHSSNPEPIKLPYLSPLVLRKELELVLDREGDVALTSPSFVDNHAIVYWNLMWYFKRMNFPTHLPQLLFQSSSLNIDDMHLDSPQPSNMLLRLVWDNPRLHEKMTIPMYKLWKDSAVKSTVVRALLTDEKGTTKGFMQQILTYVECNDIYTPLRQIINNRRLQPAATRSQSAYRDILFLSFMYFGRDIMDHDAFDREYKLAFKRLSLTDKQYLNDSDSPPTPTVMWCRKLFGNLDVSP